MSFGFKGLSIALNIAPTTWSPFGSSMVNYMRGRLFLRRVTKSQTRLTGLSTRRQDSFQGSWLFLSLCIFTERAVETVPKRQHWKYSQESIHTQSLDGAHTQFSFGVLETGLKPTGVESFRIGLPMKETQKMQFQSLGWEDPLEEEMATHYNILAWQISWTEEPSRLHSVRSQRVTNDWAYKKMHKYKIY